jgi:hypothetical protein
MNALFIGCRWWLVLAVLASIGCGSGTSGGKHRISGTILFEGQRIEAGTISFAPEQGPGRPASAMFTDGQYKLEAKKGLTPGKYVVKIFANAKETGKLSPEELMIGGAGNSNRPKAPEQTIPANYNTKSTQVIEVTTKGPNVFDFDIPR